MSFLNGIGSLASGLLNFTDNAVQDQQASVDAAQAAAAKAAATAAAAPPAAPEAAPAAPAPDTAAPAPTAAAGRPGQKLPAGSNPYGAGPNAKALWTAENAIKGPESGGKADAQNPVTSAGGLFQVIDSTWDSTVNKLGMKVPTTDAERNAQKYDPQLNTMVMRQLNQDAAAALEAKGLPVTVESLMASHRLGTAGAAAAIRAAMTNPNAPLVGNGLAPGAVRGNGDVANLTVGQFLANPYPRARA